MAPGLELAPVVPPGVLACRRCARQGKPRPPAAVTCISGWSGCCRAAVSSARASLVPGLGVDCARACGQMGMLACGVGRHHRPVAPAALRYCGVVAAGWGAVSARAAWSTVFAWHPG